VLKLAVSLWQRGKHPQLVDGAELNCGLCRCEIVVNGRRRKSLKWRNGIVASATSGTKGTRAPYSETGSSRPAAAAALAMLELAALIFSAYCSVLSCDAVTMRVPSGE
jgi:hypothetical protein